MEIREKGLSPKRYNFPEEKPSQQKLQALEKGLGEGSLFFSYFPVFTLEARADERASESATSKSSSWLPPFNLKQAFQALQAPQSCYESEGQRIERKEDCFTCRMLEGPLKGFLFVFQHHPSSKTLVIEVWAPHLSAYQSLKTRQRHWARSLKRRTGFHIHLEVRHVL